MSVRRTLLAVAAIGLSISLAAPAGADQGLGVDTQFAGSVVATTQEVVDGSRDNRAGSPEMWGECFYHGTTTTSGGEMAFTFGGSGVAYSTVPTSVQPISVTIYCELVSPRRPGDTVDTLSKTTGIIMSGPSATTPPGAVVWPFRPVYVCVWGVADFGPIPDTKPLPRRCSNDPIPIVP